MKFSRWIEGARERAWLREVKVQGRIQRWCKAFLAQGWLIFTVSVFVLEFNPKFSAKTKTLCCWCSEKCRERGCVPYPGRIQVSKRASLVTQTVKNLPAMPETPLDWEDSPGGRHGNPLQYSCRENRMDRGAWRAAVDNMAQNRIWLKGLSTHAGLKEELKGLRQMTLTVQREEEIIGIKGAEAPGNPHRHWQDSWISPDGRWVNSIYCALKINIREK